MASQSDLQQFLEDAWSRRREGNYEEARAQVLKAGEACRDDDYNTLGRVYHIYMQLEYDRDNFDDALVLCRKSVAFYEKSGDTDKIAHATRHLADLLCAVGNYAESESKYRDAIKLYDDSTLSHRGDIANALRGFAIVLEKGNKRQEAIAIWGRVRESYRECKLQAGVDEANQRLAALQA